MKTPTTVAQLIEFLQKQPQDLPVAYSLYSEYALLELKDIGVRELPRPRVDGWIHTPWQSDTTPVPTIKYLVLPGN